MESLWTGCGKTVENMIFQDTFWPFSAIPGQNRGLFRRFRKSFSRFQAQNRTERAESPGTVTKITPRNRKRFRKSFLLFFKNLKKSEKISLKSILYLDKMIVMCYN